MRWFRSHARLGSWLALSALALQLALSFGHIHRKDVLGQADASSGPVIAALAPEPEAQEPAAPPADRASHEHEDEYCAIYAINSLIGCSQTAAPPAVPLPPIAGRVQVAIGHQSLLAERRHAGSQARAPPIV
jgi:hypothetical protein